MSDETRRFSGSQRVALWLYADGKCEFCGVELDPGWHADHVQPYSKGGPTDVINGAALCPTCNLKKGNTMEENMNQDPRSLWQADALERFFATGYDFLVTATPGAGKTKMALQGAKKLYEDGKIKRIIVIVPTDNLRGQWSDNAHREGLDLSGSYQNGTASLTAADHGVIATYQQVCASPELWRRHCSVPTLVIFDEIHHAGDDSAWGKSLKHAFGNAHRRLMLSGTPFRTDGTPIPFISYDDTGLSISHAGINMADAVARGVIRPVRFETLTGGASVEMKNVQYTYDLADAPDFIRPSIWRAMREPEQRWISDGFALADIALSRMRVNVPNAGGIIYSADINSADKYAQIMSEICGERVSVVHSETQGNSNRLIKRFAEGSARWLISVKMVSEGVDIPRAMVGFYASHITTEMWFRQVVGRHVRRMEGDQDEPAILFIPTHPELQSIAEMIESESNMGLREKDLTQENLGNLELFNDPLIVRSLWASEAQLGDTIFRGESTDAVWVQYAERLLKKEGLIDQFHPSVAARLLKAANNNPMPSSDSKSNMQTQQSLTPDEQRWKLRKKIEGMVGAVARANQIEHKDINIKLRQRFGPRDEASLDSLRSQIDLLNQWLKSGSFFEVMS